MSWHDTSVYYDYRVANRHRRQVERMREMGYDFDQNQILSGYQNRNRDIPAPQAPSPTAQPSVMNASGYQESQRHRQTQEKSEYERYIQAVQELKAQGEDFKTAEEIEAEITDESRQVRERYEAAIAPAMEGGLSWDTGAQLLASYPFMLEPENLAAMGASMAIPGGTLFNLGRWSSIALKMGIEAGLGGVAQHSVQERFLNDFWTRQGMSPEVRDKRARENTIFSALLGAGIVGVAGVGGIGAAKARSLYRVHVQGLNERRFKPRKTGSTEIVTHTVEHDKPKHGLDLADALDYTRFAQIDRNAELARARDTLRIQAGDLSQTDLRQSLTWSWVRKQADSFSDALRQKLEGVSPKTRGPLPANIIREHGDEIAERLNQNIETFLEGKPGSRSADGVWQPDSRLRGPELRAVQRRISELQETMGRVLDKDAETRARSVLASDPERAQAAVDAFLASEPSMGSLATLLTHPEAAVRSAAIERLNALREFMTPEGRDWLNKQIMLHQARSAAPTDDLGAHFRAIDKATKEILGLQPDEVGFRPFLTPEQIQKLRDEGYDTPLPRSGLLGADEADAAHYATIMNEAAKKEVDDTELEQSLKDALNELDDDELLPALDSDGEIIPEGEGGEIRMVSKDEFLESIRRDEREAREFAACIRSN